MWSKTNTLSNLLSRLRFPSTTTRHPRSLSKFAKYKGSEMRLVLLFGYSVFENVLKEEYYSHLLLLVLALHYVSNQSLQTLRKKIHIKSPFYRQSHVL